jgi:hypothetical protein
MIYLKRFEDVNTKTNEGLKNKMDNRINKIKKIRWSDVRTYSSKIWTVVKREGIETKQAANILARMIDGEEVSDNEKKFLKEQSKDLIRIISTSVLPIPITAVLSLIGKKYNFKVCPGEQQELKYLIEKEKLELGSTIEEEKEYSFSSSLLLLFYNRRNNFLFIIIIKPI